MTIKQLIPVRYNIRHTREGGYPDVKMTFYEIVKFDEPITSDQVLGKVISIERNGSRLNPYSFRHKLTYWARNQTSHLKRLQN
jgi:hypothetical protein